MARATKPADLKWFCVVVVMPFCRYFAAPFAWLLRHVTVADSIPYSHARSNLRVRFRLGMAVDRELAEVEGELRGWAFPLDDASMAALHERAAALWRERSLALVDPHYGDALVVLGVGLYVATMVLTRGWRW